MELFAEMRELAGGREEAEAVLARLVRARRGDVMMLHSAGGAGGMSVIAWEPVVTVEYGDGGMLGEMERAMGEVKWESPHRMVGWLGFVSYEVGRGLERIGEGRREGRGEEWKWPVMRWSVFRNYLVRDGEGRWMGVCVAGSEEAARGGNFAGMAELCRGGAAEVREAGAVEVVEAISAARYCEKILRVREYIGAGDIYQANLAQQWRVRTGDEPVDIFQRLMRLSPALYAAFMRFTGPDGVERHVLSASPELFVQVQEGQLETRPIKGTRRREVGDTARDAELRAELWASEKDRAELAMIVDLLRNDVGRVARFGTVRVKEARGMEKHPTVWHTAATIVGEVRAEVGLAETLAALCPGGSITGVPKIRAMQIIEELEEFRRGLYCGNIGLIGPQAGEGRRLADMTLSIAIRTILMEGGVAQVCAGGGIVADSEAGLEYEETLIKARAMLEALGVRGGVGGGG